MVSDSITTPTASGVKDFGKKKKANRSAKLKQNKLEARREQWLSQGGVKIKGGKGQQAGPHRSVPASLPREKGTENGLTESENGSGIQHHFDLNSPGNSPTGSSILGGTDSGTNFSASSSSRSSSGGCCSGTITEEERDDDDDNDSCFDDWETAADADAAKEGSRGASDSPGLEQEKVGSEHVPVVGLRASSCNLVSIPVHMTQDCFSVEAQQVAPQRPKAWMPDDTSRPQTLPNLSKQLSFPNNTDGLYAQRAFHWGHANGGGVNGPSSCPVCTEDLDLTDASFLPCSCGFQVCLFCYKKMLELDGRCPNCRNVYNCDPVELEASVHGGNQLTIRLARSCSLMERS